MALLEHEYEAGNHAFISLRQAGRGVVADYSCNKPAWGINITKETIPILAEKYWFEKVLLKDK